VNAYWLIIITDAEPDQLQFKLYAPPTREANTNMMYFAYPCQYELILIIVRSKVFNGKGWPSWSLTSKFLILWNNTTHFSFFFCIYRNKIFISINCYYFVNLKCVLIQVHSLILITFFSVQVYVIHNFHNLTCLYH
jgi:hypothetical protein